jgi:hypothetical protein
MPFGVGYEQKDRGLAIDILRFVVSNMVLHDSSASSTKELCLR